MSPCVRPSPRLLTAPAALAQTLHRVRATAGRAAAVGRRCDGAAERVHQVPQAGAGRRDCGRRGRRGQGQGVGADHGAAAGGAGAHLGGDGQDAAEPRGDGGAREARRGAVHRVDHGRRQQRRAGRGVQQPGGHRGAAHGGGRDQEARGDAGHHERDQAEGRAAPRGHRGRAVVTRAADHGAAGGGAPGQGAALRQARRRVSEINSPTAPAVARLPACLPTL
mmetsp:Transcript_7348/g.18967  ORF Transcript_7348/g.18967 Transcript_7348/m.18967 type:complete len:222 (+) Transcript_7348:415-1080(+)